MGIILTDSQGSWENMPPVLDSRLVETFRYLPQHHGAASVFDNLMILVGADSNLKIMEVACVYDS